MGPLPVTNLGNQYILIVGDLFTKYIETAALPSIETAVIIQLLLSKILFRHGPPHTFLTDRETTFTLILITQHCKDLNVNKVLTSSYHSQCAGFVERINGIIMEIVDMYVASDHKDWDTYFSPTRFAYNTSLSETTGDTPFFLTYVREPVKLPDGALLPPMIRSKSVDYHREQVIWQIKTAKQLAAECTQQAQKHKKLYYDQHAKDKAIKSGFITLLLNWDCQKNFVPCGMALFGW